MHVRQDIFALKDMSLNYIPSGSYPHYPLSGHASIRRGG